ncbi:hypothetical protein [Photobacterium carnosum]|nr:hypothetical protein [Photobacterium carnosum]
MKELREKTNEATAITVDSIEIRVVATQYISIAAAIIGYSTIINL